LDVDLIKGSSFTKTKPGYHWTQVTASGLLKIIFFPVFIRWWKSQISQWVWAFLTLYFVQLFGLVIYFVYQGDESLVDISWPEAFVPIMSKGIDSGRGAVYPCCFIEFHQANGS